MNDKMTLQEQLEHNFDEHVNGRGKQLTVKKKQVKTKKLIKDLLRLRGSFADWDDPRRKKVDLVLNALDKNQKYINYDQTVEKLKEKAKGEEQLPAALKMLELHYLDLSMTVIEKNRMRRRYTRARSKLKKFAKNTKSK